MGNVMAYSGITTKVRAMSAKLLKEKDYDTIAGLGTVTEAIEYLKDKTAYAPYVERNIMVRLPESEIPERERCLIMIWHWICIIFLRCGKRENGF